MKNLNNRALTIYSKFWLLVLNAFLMIMISSCSSSSDSPPAFTPQNTLDGKLVVLGAQDNGTTLEIYVTGTDLDGTPLNVTQLEMATLKVDAASYTDDDGDLTIAAVAHGAPILSLSLLTDYSRSTDTELDVVSGIYTDILDLLPPVFEAQVATFSNDIEIQRVWTTDLQDLKDGVLLAHSESDQTALYDSMGAALEGDPGDPTDGLIDRCRPAHMLVVFTDGTDNLANVYTDPQDLADIANLDKTVVIMLGTSNARADVLTTLAGDYGAVVQVNDPAGLPDELTNFAGSLDNMVKFTLNKITAGQAISITLGSSPTVVVDPNTHCTPSI